MSTHLRPDVVFTKKLPKINGKKALKIELFEANQWKKVYTRGSKIVASPPMIDDNCLDCLYRIKIDGRWHTENGFDMTFYPIKKIMEVLAIG